MVIEKAALYLSAEMGAARVTRGILGSEGREM